MCFLVDEVAWFAVGAGGVAFADEHPACEQQARRLIAVRGQPARNDEIV